VYEFLKAIAEANDWVFEYARTDFQNLADIEYDKVHLFVDPISTESKFSDSGSETLTYSGKFMLLLSSDVDEEYQDKYEQHIKPLFAGAGALLKDAFACSDYQLNLYKSLEVINLFDQNFDGLLITYSITDLG
jgi:hypothetical protein